MIEIVEPTLENALSTQELLFTHYKRLGKLTVDEVRKYVADPSDEQKVENQLEKLKNPTCNRVVAGNKQPIYAGMYDDEQTMVGLVKVAKYVPRDNTGFRNDKNAYLNIHELVVASQELFTPMINETLIFARNRMGIPPEHMASVETFDQKSEISPYINAGFVIHTKHIQQYKFGSKVLFVSRLVKPNLYIG